MLRAVVYFALVFGVGFLLGIIRVLALGPSVGEQWAELAEMPLMLIAIVLSARFVVRRFPAPDRASYLVSGGIALVLMVIVELGVVLAIRRVSFSQYLAQRDPVAGSVYVAMLVVFAVMPWLLGRTMSARGN
jgi:hypothetical protein